MVSGQNLNDKNVLIDVDYYRGLVQTQIGLRRYESALFWAEKICAWTKYEASDVYIQAECIYLLGEYHRAAHLIKFHGYETTHFKCHLLLVECLFAAKNFNECRDVINDVDSECLYYSTYPKQKDAGARNDMLASLCFLKGKIFEALDKSSLAIDCYIAALRYSIFCYEALENLVKHEMLFAWEEQEILNHMPVIEQCPEGHAKMIVKLYELKLKRFTDPIDAETKVKDSIVQGHPVIKGIIDQVNHLKEDKSKQMKRHKTIPVPEMLSTFSRPPSPQVNVQKNFQNERKSMSSFRLNVSVSEQPPVTSVSLYDCFERNPSSTDVLLARAKMLFNKYEYRKCLKVLDEILARDPFHIVSVTYQVGCLFELRDYNKLFYVGHKLVDLYPDRSVSWYAVGSYYDLIDKCDLARRYFSKATALDRLFSPAWIAYGHSFAKENEHDQAMAAYFKASQLMRGCHLPLLYIGIECGLTKNFDLAEMFFLRALSVAPMDVFILHELAVSKFESEDFESAEKLFSATLDMVTAVAAQNREPIPATWEPLLNNLAHCMRKNRRYREALELHKRALVLRPQTASTFTAIGFVQTLLGQLENAIDSFHKSLALCHDEIFTLTILQYVTDDLKEELDVYTPAFLEADELLGPNFRGVGVGGALPQVVLTCDDEDVSGGLEDSSKQNSGVVLGLSSASVSGVVALDDTSVNMSIE